jgi:hypothetical protein
MYYVYLVVIVVGAVDWWISPVSGVYGGMAERKAVLITAYNRFGYP